MWFGQSSSGSNSKIEASTLACIYQEKVTIAVPSYIDWKPLFRKLTRRVVDIIYAGKIMESIFLIVQAVCPQHLTRWKVPSCDM